MSELICWFKDVMSGTDIIAVVFTLFVVVLASVKNWMVAEASLKPAYVMMIALGIAQGCLNTYLGIINDGQAVLLLLNIPAIWVALMGIKGLRKLKASKRTS